MDLVAPAKSGLTRRVISASVLVPFVALLIYLNYWWFALLTAAAVVLALREMYTMLRVSGKYQPRVFSGIGCGLALWAAGVAHYVFPANHATITWVGLALTFSLLLMLTGELLSHADDHTSMASWAITFALAVYIGWLLGCYPMLRGLEIPITGGWLAALAIPAGAAWVYLVLAVTWMTDAGAFFVGRAVGHRPLAPHISPRKTLEGALGGIVAAILTALLCVPLLGLPLSIPAAVVLGLVGGLAAVVGDLIVSQIKRQIGAKDSGSLIPGHGGLLDRLDSMLFTGPILYYLIVLLTPSG